VFQKHAYPNCDIPLGRLSLLPPVAESDGIVADVVGFFLILLSSFFAAVSIREKSLYGSFGASVLTAVRTAQFGNPPPGSA